MDGLEIKPVKQLPLVRALETSMEEWSEVLVNACQVMSEIYSKHVDLEHLAGRLRVSVYHPNVVTFTDADGKTQEGIGAVVGPKGAKPVVTILVTMDESPRALVCNSTQDWVNQFGLGELPTADEEIDLDRL